MDVLKCAAIDYGEQYAVMNFGMITMLEFFAISWAFQSMVRHIVRITFMPLISLCSMCFGIITRV